MNAIFMFYSDADFVGSQAKAAHAMACRGDKAGALEALLLLQEKYGDLWRLKMHLTDAIAEMEAT